MLPPYLPSRHGGQLLVEDSRDQGTEEEEQDNDSKRENAEAPAAHKASLAKLSRAQEVVCEYIHVVQECHTHDPWGENTSIVGTFAHLAEANAAALCCLKDNYGEDWDEYEENWEGDNTVKVNAKGGEDESFEITVSETKWRWRVRESLLLDVPSGYLVIILLNEM